MAGIFGLLMSGAGVLKDQYFNLTSLLLPGNGTNGAQNNTFLDSSTNNFTITRNGDTTQGTFSPFSQTGWGNYFDGSNDYLSAPSSSSFNLASSSFTIEVWVYYTSVGLKTIVNTYGGTTTGWALQTNSSSQLTFNASGDGADITGTTALNANQWYHVAVSGTAGSSIKMFLNGTQEGSTYTGNITDASTALLIGQIASSNWFTGYMSNLRIIKGTALYTSNFTPPTSPLTAVSNTVLLTCQSNRFVDNAATPNTITATGGTAITPFSPFAPTSSYSAAAVGGSGYFDGSGDYLTANSAGLELGSNLFTVDGWFYCTGYNGGGAIYSSVNTYPSSTGLLFYVNSTGGYVIDVNGTNIISTGTAPLNTWTHFAIVRSSTGSNGVTLYINGSALTPGTSATNFSSTYAVIGRTGFGAASNYWLGYLSGIRVVVGSANVPSSVPTSPPTAITNTALLLNFTNAGVVDATAKNVLETEGNAQISTAQSKWGGGSILLDGTGDYLNVPTTPLLSLGSAAFTIEMWVNFSASVSGAGYVLVSKAPNSFTPQASWNFWRNTSNKLRFIFSTDGGATNLGIIDTTNNFTPTTGQWYYLAVTRSGSTWAIYIDGVSQSLTTSTTGSATLSSAIFNSTTPLVVGATSDGVSTLNGYVDDLRITTGVARTITASPTAPFPLQ